MTPLPPCSSAAGAQPQRRPPLIVPGMSFQGHSRVSKPRMRFEDVGQIASIFICFQTWYAVI